MSVVTHYDPSDSLIIVEALVRGPRETRSLLLALDTGATLTLLTPDVLDMLGYSARDGHRVTSVTSAIGRERGFSVTVSEISALGFAVPDVRVNAFELPDNVEFDGLLGLSFLMHFNYEIRSVEGRICVERAVA